MSCLLCGKSLTEGKTWEVSRGMDALRRGTEKSLPAVHQVLLGLSTVTVHEACRKKYTRGTSAGSSRPRTRTVSGAAAPLSSTVSSLRSATQNFDYQKNCLVCGQVINRSWGNTNVVSAVTRTDSRVRFLNACDQRGDNWASMVRARVQGASDLVAIGARYHRMCYADFLHKDRSFEMFRTPPPSSANTSVSSLSPATPQRSPAQSLERATGTSPAPLVDLTSPPPRPPVVPFATPQPVGRVPKGRPTDPSKLDNFLNLCRYLEQNDECQFSLRDLYDRMGKDSHCYGETHLQRLLVAKYRGNIKFYPRKGRDTLCCFSGAAEKLLTDAWYQQRKNVESNERMRIIETAADIILEDVSCSCFETDTYPTAAEIQDGGWNSVPRSLRTLLMRLVTRRKKGADQTNNLRKCNAIGQEILSAMRPRSYVSPLQVGLSVYIHRLYASRQLIDVLNSLGKCASYREAIQFERAVVEHAPPELLPGAYLQHAFDNADFNIRTLDGLNTCHITGGVAAVTPADCVLADKPVPRGEKITAAQVSKHGSLPVVEYKRPPNPGLAAMTVTDMRPSAAWDLVTDQLLKGVGVAKRMDLLWLAGTAFQQTESPSWFGFMERAFEGTPQHSVSAFIPTPFVNMEASNPSAIRTTLEYAVAQAEELGQQSVPVTMDQPLFQKAAEMIVTENEDSAIRNVIISLGGFHLLMSFLGAIGYIMAGSGIAELWGKVYAELAVQHMLTGKAFARSVRAHLLTVAVLFKEMCAENAAMSNDLKKKTAGLFNSVFEKDVTMAQAVQDMDLKHLQAAVDVQLQQLSASGRQGKLWVQYFRMVSLLLLFLRAARSADWHLHMYCIREMLPYFVASGHINYARSALLFLHLMTDLERRMPPLEYHKLVQQGYFVVYRSNKEFAGLWMDLVVEQVVMRVMKIHGGLTQGRGLTDSVKATWIKAMTACAKIILAVEQYTRQRSTSCEQHVELRRSRRVTDKKDREKLEKWLTAHPPLTNPQVLRCLSTGTVAGPNINAQDALEQGCATLQKLIGQDFKSVVFPRADKVLTIKSELSAVKIGERLVPVNTSTLFHRITVLVDSSDLPGCFAYELAPMPTALFDQNGAMRKATKSSLAECIENRTPCIQAVPADCLYVLDGGALLRRVKWPTPGTYRDVIRKYVTHVELKYGASKSWVIYDGYVDKPSTKDCEHARRQATGTCLDLLFDEVMEAEEQYKFLTNSNNKKRLIEMLMSAMQRQGIAVDQAEGDADYLIVNTAVRVANEALKPVVVVAEDTDVLALLVNHAGRASADLYQMSQAGSNKNKKQAQDQPKNKIYDVSAIRKDLKEASDCIIFEHAITGTDTTSALYMKGKREPLKKLEKSENLRQLAKVFYNRTSSRQEVAAAGEAFMLACYGFPATNLDDARYKAYLRQIAKKSVASKIDLALLPPTSAAAIQHSFRVYQQVQAWLGNELPPTDWGWKLSPTGHLAPVMTTLLAAPPKVLELTACACKGNCSNRHCGCVRAGDRCSPMCANCCGQACSNAMLDIPEDDDLDDDGGGYGGGEDEDIDPDDPVL